jgi:hypothetical protein
LSIFFKLFKIKHLTPSINLVIISATVSAFAIVLFQITCLYFTLRTLTFIPKLALPANEAHFFQLALQSAPRNP